jgi:hypothetical protein
MSAQSTPIAKSVLPVILSPLRSEALYCGCHGGVDRCCVGHIELRHEHVGQLGQFFARVRIAHCGDHLPIIF